MQNHDYVTYEEFGRRFFEVAVTPDASRRVADIAGGEFAMGRSPRAPADRPRLAQIREPRVTRKLGDLITFVIHIRCRSVSAGCLDKQRFMVMATSRCATARAEPLLY